MKIQASRKDSIWSVIGIVLSMGSNLIILPFILHYLDDQTVGLYYVFINLYAIISLMDFGFAPNFARSVAYAWSGAEKLISYDVAPSQGNEPNWVLMKKIASCCKYIYLGISLLSLVLCSTAGSVYIYFITKDVNIISNFISWGIFVCAIFTSLYFGYFGALLRGVGAIAQTNKATVISRIIQIVVCIILLSCGCGLIGVSIGYFIYGISFRFIAKKEFYHYYNIKRKLADVKIPISRAEIRETLLAIWPNTWREGLITVSNYLLNQATTLIASVTLSLYETGVYSLMVQLVSAVATLAGVFYTSYQPTLQSSRANNDFEGQKRTVSIMISSFVYLFIMGTVFMIVAIVPLVKIIKPSYVIGTGLLLLVSFLYFVTRIRDCFCAYFAATNRLIYTKMFIISSVLCVVLAWVFSSVFKWGLVGLILAQIGSQVVYNFWYWPYKANQELHLTLKRIFVNAPVELLQDLLKRK